MAAFELNKKGDEQEATPTAETVEVAEDKKVKEECIIALKVYDSCRQQDCLTPNELGPARAAECKEIGGEVIREGDIIDPPSNDGGMIENMVFQKVVWYNVDNGFNIVLHNNEERREWT